MRQLWTGTPSSQTVQAPQSPASHPFLTPNQPSSRRKVRRHWPARRLLGERLAVDVDRSWRSPQAAPASASSRPNLLGEVVGHVLAVVRRSVDVVEVASSSGISSCRRSRRRRGHREPRGNVSCTGCGVAAVTVSTNVAVRRGERCRSASAVERPMWVSDIRRNAARLRSAEAGSSMRAQQLARLQDVLMVPGDEVDRPAPGARCRRAICRV